ncbi:DMT family transporter [Pseudomonas beijingensis]|jgi:drug/metabolite transporter (DMT)-like permease|uniref:DMT family transporter n=1 Tax=Pseudomonas beijingensis TaxID=2954101 RepID=A0ABY9F5F0_9PSED|nr:DMT family transporter [Pseudomonas sp. FP2034]WLG98857.1 DMT family transporter [Pseudomonas sp. FP2034]
MNDNRKGAMVGDRKSWILPALVSLFAFAANSLFCRLALIDGDIDPESFTAIRLLSGAIFLLLLLRMKSLSKAKGGSWKGGVLLFIYAWFFSLAYVELGAGIGALILFGSVQITMFTYSWCKGERVSYSVLAGMLIAFSGLIILLLPGSTAPEFHDSMMMAISGIAWGAYSLIGRGAVNPIADTSGNFLKSLPFLTCLLWGVVSGEGPQVSGAGLVYAVASGVLASGAGYAIWYGVVKRISAHHAAILQLSVPIIASLGAVIFLGEPISSRLLIATIAVLGGVALSLASSRKKDVAFN